MNSARNTPNLTYVKVISQMHSTIGLRGFMRGVLPPVVFRGFSTGFGRFGYGLGDNFFTVRGGHKVKALKGNELLLTAALSGLFQVVGDHPLYIVKNRAQATQSVEFKETFNSYWRMCKEITRSEGLYGWSRGLVPGILFGITSYPAFYMLYDFLRSMDFGPIAAGSIGAVFSWPVGMQFDILRVRMQCSEQRVTFREAAGHLLRQPVRGWFAGFGATCIRAAPRYAICMWSIEKSNDFFRNHHF